LAASEEIKGGTYILDVRKRRFDSLGEAFTIVHLFLDERGFSEDEFQLQRFVVTV
jgi:hypothetical protein